MTKSRIIIPAMLLALSLAWIGCGSDEATGTASITVRTDITFGGEPLDTSTVYFIDNNEIKIDVSKFYLGGLTLQNGDAVIDQKSRYILVEEQAKNTLIFEGVDVASGISSIGFHIGVDPETNAQSEASFLSRPIEDPLAIQDPAMHWNWNTGYRFVRIDGKLYRPIIELVTDTVVTTEVNQIDSIFIINGQSIDSMYNDTVNVVRIFADSLTVGTDTLAIEYHLGTDALLSPILLTEGFDRLRADDNTLLIRFDIKEMLQGTKYDSLGQQQTHTFDNMDLALRLRNNISERAIGYRLN